MLFSPREFKCVSRALALVVRRRVFRWVIAECWACYRRNLKANGQAIIFACLYYYCCKAVCVVVAILVVANPTCSSHACFGPCAYENMKTKIWCEIFIISCKTVRILINVLLRNWRLLTLWVTGDRWAATDEWEGSRTHLTQQYLDSAASSLIRVSTRPSHS